MSNLVIQHINRLATSEGYTRDTDLGLGLLADTIINDLDSALQDAHKPHCLIWCQSIIVQDKFNWRITLRSHQMDNDRAASATDIQDALIIMDGTRLTYE